MGTLRRGRAGVGACRPGARLCQLWPPGGASPLQGGSALCGPGAAPLWLTRSEVTSGLAWQVVFAEALDALRLQRWHRKNPLKVREDEQGGGR